MRYLFIILCLTFFTGESLAQKRAVVSVVFSSDIEQYLQSWQGVMEFFDKRSIPLWVDKYNLKEMTSSAIILQIKKKQPDIIFILGTNALELISREIKDIPVVFSTVLVNNRVFGDNVTGVSLDIPWNIKLKETKKILPNKERIGIIYSSKTTPINEIRLSCQELGFKPLIKKIDAPKDFPRIIKEFSWQIDCFLMIVDTTLYLPQVTEYLLLESLKAKFPVIGLSSYYTKAGAVLSFDCDYKDLGRQAGEISLRILQGEKPSNIPVVRPEKIKFSLNLSAAERMNIKIPDSIIKQASEVFGK